MFSGSHQTQLLATKGLRVPFNGLLSRLFLFFFFFLQGGELSQKPWMPFILNRESAVINKTLKCHFSQMMVSGGGGDEEDLS